MNEKTTIAIILNSRQKLGKIKLVLEAERDTFVDMDEVMRYLLENISNDMAQKIEKFNK